MRIQLAKWALNKIHPRARLLHLPLPLHSAAVTTAKLLNPFSLPQTARRFQTQAATRQRGDRKPKNGRFDNKRGRGRGGRGGGRGGGGGGGRDNKDKGEGKRRDLGRNADG
ncbi:hypothetical protein PG991_010958 [Apiospora marii]|uniref:Uncharacterized protein n=1 Tax=Apiospora marii TaxID=335849 RepID=A0ABR1RCT5_9PEZI